MAHLIRGKQAGIQNDFSAGIEPGAFMLDDLRRFGISSQISKIAFDPVQSLLAVGTNESQYGTGQVYVFGQGRVSATLQLQRKASVRDLQFCSDRLLCLDSKNDLTVFSLATKKIVGSYSPPATVTALASDPTLDFAILGLQNGEIVAYDMDREGLAPFKLPCFWQEVNPRARTIPIVTLQFHPRDIGKLLIGYAEGAVVYSFKQNKPQQFFHYQLQRGAPGGDATPTAMNVARNPKLTQATWHPTGTFIITGHDDSSLVIWDPREGRMISARTVTETKIESPTAATPTSRGDSQSPKTPIFKIVWCANQDPDETGLLIAGGTSTDEPSRSLTFFELGRTPNYTTSTWEMLSDHFDNPKRQKFLPMPANVQVIDICLIPRKSPWFAGAQDPIAIISLLSSGEITTSSFPSGYPISPTNQLHLSLTFIHPFVTCLSQTAMERTRWLGMVETRSSGPKILSGGTETIHPPARNEFRNVLQTAHADGTVRLWDASHGDEVENKTALQADVARAVGRFDNVQITCVSLSGASSEMAAGLRSGEVAVFRWSRNDRPGQEPGPPSPNRPGVLTNVTDRKDPSLAEGFHPFTLLNQQDGPVTALRVSDVGFIAAGFEGGTLVVIDMRGPAIIHNANINEHFQKGKSGPFRRKSEPSPKSTFPSCLEFSTMTADEDEYSSILLHCGCSTGQVATFKILPRQGGQYGVNYVGSTNLEEKIISLTPLSSASSRFAYATPSAVASLRNGSKVDGVVLAVTKTEARIFRPSSGKGAHKSWDANAFCDSAAVTQVHGEGHALVCLFGDGTARSYSIPGLREIASTRIDHILDVRRLANNVVTRTGEIIGWTGPSEVALLNAWGVGENVPHASQDKIFNSELLIPPRPTISNFQWVSGSQYITPSDLDVLIGGPDRPPSKRMIAQARADEAARRADARGPGASTAGVNAQEGWGEYLTRQLNERTERLNIMGDRMDNLEQNSSGWAEDVNKFVGRQKKNLVMGVVKSKFGF